MTAGDRPSPVDGDVARRDSALSGTRCSDSYPVAIRDTARGGAHFQIYSKGANN